jgi:putative restriction endonuclease
MTSMSSVVASRLEKTATDNGFDQPLPRDGDWLGFASTHAPTRLWLTAYGEGLVLAAVSQSSVARALRDHGSAFTNPLPLGAVGARGVADIPSLHRLVRRAFQLSRTLPDELLHVFEKRVAGLPRTTEVERLDI